MTTEMTTKQVESDRTTATEHYETTWGPWLFRLTLAGTLLFMWWLVIYDHGVVSHH